MTTEREAEAVEALRQRKRAYLLTFGSPIGQEVLKDLVKFCRGAETQFNENQRKTDVLIGRHEVWLRIEQHMNLNSQQLFALYTGKHIGAINELEALDDSAV